MRSTIAFRPVRRAAVHVRRPARLRGRPSAKRGSLVGTIVACMLVGSFVGIVGWKLAESIGGPPPRTDEQAPRHAVAVVPPPSVPRAPHRDPELATLVHQQLPPVGNVGVYAKNLSSGAEAEVHGERAFPAASLFKLPVLVEVIRQARLGLISLDQELVIGRQHWVPGSGVLQARIGDRLRVRELLRLLVAESDNIAAMRLLDFVGLDDVNQTMRGMGLRGTRLQNWRASGVYGGDGPYVTTASDVGLLLEIIANGRLVDADGSDEAIRLLESRQAKSWLGEPLPWWARVAHKWGEVPGARHDAGIIFAQNSAYILVVLTEGVDANNSDDVIRNISRSVFGHFESAH